MSTSWVVEGGVRTEIIFAVSIYISNPKVSNSKFRVKISGLPSGSLSKVHSVLSYSWECLCKGGRVSKLEDKPSSPIWPDQYKLLIQSVIKYPKKQLNPGAEPEIVPVPREKPINVVVPADTLYLEMIIFLSGISHIEPFFHFKLEKTTSATEGGI